MLEENKNKSATPTPIKEDLLKEYISDLASMAPAEQWNIGKHLALIARIAEEHGLPESSKLDFKASLRLHGIGGNMSQFTQWAADQQIIIRAARKLDEYD